METQTITIRGTCYFKSLEHAEEYYQCAEQVGYALEDNAIAIGKPELKDNDTLLIDDDGRYHIARRADGQPIEFLSSVRLRERGLSKV